MNNDMYIKMTETKISKLIPRLAIPTIITMLVTSIYNMADTFFVSQIGTSASAAVGINFSLMAMIQAIGFTLGMGSGNYVSRSLGNQDGEGAHRAAATAFFTALILGGTLSIIGLLNLDKFVKILGATPTIVPYAKDYAKYILIGTPYMCCAFVLNNLHRSQGNAFYSMLGLVTGGILNMILDPILIFKFNMGISGAAIATIFSQFISFGILFFMSQRNKKNVTIKISKFTLKPWVYKEIFKAGLPSLSRQGLASMAAVALNVCASPFGDAAIAAMSITVRIMLFINSSLIGFGQGFQPVCGYNYGAKKYERVLEAYYFCLKVGVILLTILGVLCFTFAPEIIALFRKEDLEVIEIGTIALRYQCLTLPIQASIVMANMLTQSIGYGFWATLVAMGRQGIFLIPALFVLPNIFGIRGLQYCQPFADICTFIVGLLVVQKVIKDLKIKISEQNLLV
ncbi:MATE family efflux transporter [Fusobacterium sp. FSA-380-WT-3A]|uniref:MATE family efflux transporter n=3 Tax=Fusobacterium TaxID=848 RepID=UPI001F0F8CA7|nr:MATE family efflux transporter [Fusobacterium sp. FSA-380-WT-3A]